MFFCLVQKLATQSADFIQKPILRDLSLTTTDLEGLSKEELKNLTGVIEEDSNDSLRHKSAKNVAGILPISS